jgi:hypothetical protein
MDWTIGFRFPAGVGIAFSVPCPERFWGPPNLLSKEYRGWKVGHEADHSPISTADVKNARIYDSTPPLRLHGVVLSYSEKHRDNFAFT